MKNQEKSQLKVFPTIFDEQLHIQTGQTIGAISVYNQTGVCIRSFHHESPSAIISMAGLPSGLYLVKASNEAAVRVYKK
jgi:hypothetical protein